MITLIANTGIQMFKQRVRLNLQAIREKMYFREWFDMDTYKLSLELVHYFPNDDVYVRKRDLWNNGFMPTGEVNRSWDDIQKETTDITQFRQDEVFALSVSSLQRGTTPVLNKFLNVWLPFPYFEYDMAGKTGLGPFNWSRIKIVPTGNVIDGCVEWDIVLAIDTTTVYDDGNYSDEYKETPVFPNEFEARKQFGVCDNDFNLLTFCSSDDRKSKWIDDYILKLVHNTDDINSITDKHQHRFNYLASYIFFIKVLRNYANLPTITLYKDRNVAKITNVNLVVDMGNSKTTALLVEEGDFTRTRMLQLQNFTQPQNVSDDSFDMNIAFQKADFGDMGLENSSQFTFPSFLRLGAEAKYLIYNAQNNKYTSEKLSICSSPKRYLWDNQKRKNEWEYVLLSSQEEHTNEPIWIDGISNQLNADGTLSATGSQGALCQYSRRSLMTFSFLEILAQARMQINSHKFREEMGEITSPRRIDKILVTCPTAMSRCEQIALRQSAEEAFVLLERFVTHTSNAPFDYKTLSKKIEIIPNVQALKNVEERTQWTYDEATCSQFVYLCAEIAERYKNNCEEYFNLYGKQRNDLDGYDKKSLTIGSLDIGAGTTDLMICAYEYSSVGQTAIKPIPLFWESFYIAGDDMLKAIIQQLIIEGPHALISNRLTKMGKSNITQMLADFFGADTNRLTFSQRQLRKDFNMQVSVPIALKYLDTAQKQIKKATFHWNDIFTTLQPSAYLLEKFYDAFGFRIEEAEWDYSEEVLNEIVVGKFDDLLKKVTAAMSAYQCDIVILSGRPTSLKQIENLFLKYYPVSPNRLKVLNNYRVGRWYPFQNGDGYFTNQKSIVAVGALLGYIASTQGGFRGLSMDLSELQKRLLPTTDYFGILNSVTNTMTSTLLSPENNSADILVNDLPLKIGTRQLDTPSYPVRAFYRLDFDDEGIEKYLRNRGYVDGAEMEDKVQNIKSSIRRHTPLTMHIVREDYSLDKETLVLDSVLNKDGDEFPLAYFRLQIQSLSENEDFWLDSGAFNLSITTH